MSKIPKDNFSRLLFQTSHAGKVNLLLEIKEKDSFEEALSYFREALKNPLTKQWLLATPFPKTYSQLKQQSVLQCSNSIWGELAYIILPITLYTNELSKFLKYRSQFEGYILKGELDSANNLLNLIQQEFGLSQWLLEKKMILAELIGGTEKNWLLHSEYIGEIHNVLLLYFLEQISKKNESKISHTRFSDLLVNQLSEFNISNALKEYILYKVCYISAKQFHHQINFLCWESVNSVIDRYLAVRIVLIEKLESLNSRQLQKVIAKLNGINDRLIDQIHNYLNLDSYITFDETKEIWEKIDNYTEGNYEYCINTIPDSISKFPQIIELYDIYVKSLIELKSEFVKTNISALIDSILEKLYNLYSKTNYNSAVEDLLKICNVHFSSDWAKQLFTLVNHLSSLNENGLTESNFYFGMSFINNPKSLSPITGGSISHNIKGLERSIQNSSTIDVFKSLSNDDFDALSKINLPPDRLRFYESRIAFYKGDYKSAILIAEELLTANPSNYLSEEINYIMYYSLLAQEDVSKSLLLYVNIYLKNPSKTKRLNANQLYYLLEKKKECIISMIEYPIFYHVFLNDSYDQYVAYDDFLMEKNVDKTSKLIGEKELFAIDKFVYFLRFVSSFEILKNSYHFSSREEIEDERLLLLDELLKIDTKNEAVYIKEITSITQNVAVKKAIREVNKGKITINIEQLKDAEAFNIKEGFSRYIELANFSKDRTIQGIEIGGRQLSEFLNSREDVKSKIVYTNDPAYLSFKSMFLEIRDKFILSKEFGLDGYLSTRIRHGTFQNYVRSIFESENLISQKDSNETYLDLFFWRDRLPIHLADKNDKLQSAIHNFSKSIDDYTEYIIKELIQVKSEKHDKKPDALFDFSISVTQLGYVFKIARENVRDHSAFIEVTFTYLTNRTNDLLVGIRNYFLHNATDKYIAFIDRFLDEIKGIIGTNTLPDLVSSINKCKTHLRRELINISEWFYLSNPSANMWLDLNTILQTSIQITNRIYPHKKIDPEISLDGITQSVKGSIHLIYIVRIILDNMLAHAKISVEEMDISIKGIIDSDLLELSFSNNISDSIDKNKIIKVLNDIKIKWEENKQDYEKTDVEGGSGFDKIRRILSFDMKRKKYLFDYKIDSNRLTIIIKLNVEQNLN